MQDALNNFLDMPVLQVPQLIFYLPTHQDCKYFGQKQMGKTERKKVIQKQRILDAPGKKPTDHHINMMLHANLFTHSAILKCN